MAVITCTHCGASGNAPDQILGQQVRCSKCKQSFVAGGDAAPVEAVLAEAASEQEQEDEGFPTNEDIARPPSSRRMSAKREEPVEDEEEETPPARSIRKPASSVNIGDLLMFRRMVAPYLIIIMFWMGVVGSILGSLVMIIMGLIAGTQGLGSVLFGLILLVMGPVYVRLSCEVLIVVFRINETLTDIRNELHRKD